MAEPHSPVQPIVYSRHPTPSNGDMLDGSRGWKTNSQISNHMPSMAFRKGAPDWKAGTNGIRAAYIYMEAKAAAGLNTPHRGGGALDPKKTPSRGRRCGPDCGGGRGRPGPVGGVEIRRDGIIKNARILKWYNRTTGVGAFRSGVKISPGSEMVSQNARMLEWHNRTLVVAVLKFEQCTRKAWVI